MMYRFKALDKKRQLDDLDSPLVLATPRGWIAVFVVLITATMIGLWGFLGNVPHKTNAPGVLGYAGGVQPVQSPYSGFVTALSVHPGQVMSAGQAMGTVRTSAGTRTLAAPMAGRVVSLGTAVGRYLGRGQQVVRVEPGYGTDAALQVQLQVGAQEVPGVRPGSPVLVTVPGVSSRRFGLLRGKVVSIAPFPAAGESDGTKVGPRSVTIALLKDSATRSGYRWTSADGPPQPLTSQTPVQAEIDSGSVTPISLLLGL